MTSLQEAYCRRCGHRLTDGKPIAQAISRASAWAVTAIILMGVTLQYPLLGFSAQGRSAHMSLWDTGGALMNSGQFILGMVVLGFIIIVPLLWLTLLLGIGLLSQSARTSAWLPRLARWLYHIKHWNMVEVYVVGMLVSLTKIASLARLELGIAFWTLLAFGVALILSEYSVGRLGLWQMVRARVERPA
ncbi:MAG: paraquat-inducible protein A [Pseudomonadota bacterium]